MHRCFRSAHARALTAYTVLTAVFCWPLPLHFGTRLFGRTTGDTGTYLWNLWVFNHELIHHHRFPFFTSTIFSLDQHANLSLHNYTVFADLLAIPLLPFIGLVRTYNLISLGAFVLNGYVMFLLVRRMGVRDRDAWLAGALFAFAPCLVARSTEHLSLMMAAPLVVFLLLLHVMDGQASPRLAAAAGVVFAWATFCDPYYGVYCLALAAWHVAWRRMVLVFAHAGTVRPAVAGTVCAAIIALVGLNVWIAGTGGWGGRVFGVPIAMRTLFTPVLFLTALILVAFGIVFRPRLVRREPPQPAPLLRLAPYGAVSAGVVISPLLYALGERVATGRYVSATPLWRSGTPGVDLGSFLLPNPNHPLFSGLSQAWLARQPGGFAENVASVTFVALVVIGLAAWWARFRPPRYWSALAIVAAALAIGPFLSIASLFTYVPTPWAILRYVPVLGGARAPARFMVIVMIALSVLFGLALKAIGERLSVRGRRWLFATVSFALLFELLPAPRPLYAARVPGIYRRVAADPRDVRVLELPFGVRDGVSSAGDFSASSLFHQTVHNKRLIGGALSRISRRRVIEIRRRPVLDALIELSEGHALPSGTDQALARIGPEFMRRARIGYVIVDRSRASPSLVEFAVRTFQLEKIDASGTRDLYRPRVAPVESDDDKPLPLLRQSPHGRHTPRP